MSIMRVGGSLARVGGALGRVGAGGGGGGARSVLTSADITIAGYYRVPNNIANMTDAGYNIAIRRVGAETRMFTWSNDNWDGLGNKLVEFVIPDGTAPNTTIGSATRMTYVRNWGNIWSGRTLTGGAAANIGSLMWDEDLHGLWWTYGDSYAPVEEHHPTLGFTHINDGTTTATSYGPWRQEWGSQRVRGGMFRVPDDFAATYTGGNTLGVMAGMSSGRAGCPYGPNGSVLDTIDPFTQAADIAIPPFGGQHTIGNQGLLLHTNVTPAARDTRYKVCSWDTPVTYDCRLGHTITPGPALWGAIGVATGVAVEDDTTASAVWVDTGSKHGLLFFGQLATTPIGYVPPGTDPDGYIHCGYGDPEHATKTGSSGSGYVNGSCCHGQPDAFWTATGPYCHYRVPHSWIYDPADFVSTIGGAALNSLTPTETIQWTNPSDGSLSWPSIAQFNRAGWVAGSCWDPITSRVYVMIRNQDSTTHWTTAKQPVLLVLQVS